MLLRQVKGSRWLYRCDWCQKEFEASIHKSKAKTHGCSRSCGSKASRATVKANLKERYGVENVGQLPEVREKVKQTVRERFGVDHTFQAESVKEKIRESCFEHYGVEYASQANVVRERVKSTNLKRYGAEHFWQTKDGREKIEQSMLTRHGVDNPRKSTKIRQEMIKRHVEKYGVENPLQRPEIIEKIRQTHREQYKVEWSFQRPEVKEKSRQTSLERYGVEHPMQHPDIQRKVIMSCLVKGKGFVSKDELRCLEMLKNEFGEVDHQVHVNGWLIDFYVKSIDTYVQFDGVYWHGLNRSLDRLQNPGSKRDRDISKKWHRDREQDGWFMNNGKRLVRITDKEFREMSSLELSHHLRYNNEH